jgi:hypothetical protein
LSRDQAKLRHQALIGNSKLRPLAGKERPEENRP